MPSIIKTIPKDAKILAKISKEAFLVPHGHSAAKEDVDNYVAKNFNEENCSKELHDVKNEYYFIFHEDKVAGFSKVIFNTPNENVAAKNITKMERLYLLEEFYGLQLGKTLFDFNVNLAKQNNQAGIWLAVWVENQRAINFYKKIGFKKVGNYDFKISENHANPNHILYLEF